MTDDNRNTEFPSDDLPNIEVFKQNLLKLKSLDLSSYSQEQIHQIVHQHTVFVPNYLYPIVGNEFCNYKLYRARFKVDPEKENVYLQSTFSYPNNAFCSENGRANIKRRNVFYCADSPMAAILESKPSTGDMGCLSIWKPIIDLREVNKLHNIAKELHAYLKSLMPQFSEKKVEHLNILNQFFCSLFVEEKPPYAISSWVANGLLYSHRGIDMVLYPSAITDSYFTNIAIHPNFADKYLQLEKVFQFTIEKKTEKNINYAIGLIGVPGNMNIEWRHPTEDEMKEIVQALNIGIDQNRS
jgi:hypothetical protein